MKIFAGERFGRLITSRKADPKIYPSGQLASRWMCLCDCGNTAVILSQHLQNGNTKSCGCLRRESSKIVNKTHGMTKTRLYKIWNMMRQRCNNPQDNAYQYYGQRGIRICGEWDNFVSFYDWAMSGGYQKELTLDRIDNNGDYEPANCRWTTALVQANNRRNNVYITYLGKTQTVPQWAKEIGIPKDTIYARTNKYGWSAEKALTEPLRRWTHQK